jgi:hypothetical protein
MKRFLSILLLSTTLHGVEVSTPPAGFVMVDVEQVCLVSPPVTRFDWLPHTWGTTFVGFNANTDANKADVFAVLEGDRWAFYWQTSTGHWRRAGNPNDMTNERVPANVLIIRRTDELKRVRFSGIFVDGLTF